VLNLNFAQRRHPISLPSESLIRRRLGAMAAESAIACQ
jgi:hypothetical protein